MNYEAFLAGKSRRIEDAGFEPSPINCSLFPFQQDIARWAIRRGRAAIFAATGLGKTRMEIEWARQVAEHTGGDVLILAPLAVAPQTVAEGHKIGVQVDHVRDGSDSHGAISATNYDRLHRFDASRYVGIVLDESSCIKHHGSKTLAMMLDLFAATPYKLSTTATPSPNDYTELGTQAEFLGAATRSEMLAEYFVHDGGETQSWRLKKHARADYWRWVASWAALVRTPADLGYDDLDYQLPELEIAHHIIPASQEDVFAMGRLFVAEAGDLSERRTARRATIGHRVERTVEIVMSEPDESWLVWGELNAETEALRRAIPGAVEVRGSDTVEHKEAALAGFVDGSIRVLISKPSICGWGLNFQHCARMAFVGVNDSWESWHQAVRRIWRFGQHRPVHVHVVASEAEGSVVANLQRKEADAMRMADELSKETRSAVRDSVLGGTRTTRPYAPNAPIAIPDWLAI